TTEYDTTYRDQAYSLIWNYSDNDTAKVEQLAADSGDAKVGLAQFFAWRIRPADALRVWNTLSDEEKNSARQTAVAIAEAMNEKRTFWEGVEFAVQADIDPDARVETITNGGFESPITAPSDTLYGWKI